MDACLPTDSEVLYVEARIERTAKCASQQLRGSRDSSRVSAGVEHGERVGRPTTEIAGPSIRPEQGPRLVVGTKPS